MTGCRRLVFLLALTILAACQQSADKQQVNGSHARLVTLAPNLTELVFAAGAGESLVGVSAYSDYPSAASQLPVIGDAFAVDRERLALLKPDLLLAWESGTPSHVVDELEALGFRVEVLRTRSLDDVATALRRIGDLTGHAESAGAAASAFTAELHALGRVNAQKEDVRVFYQVSARPLYTITGEHYVSELIGLCGGSNVFAGLEDLAPVVDVESVVAKDPEVILASSDAADDAFEIWKRWPALAANRYGNHFLMPADEIGRATPRLIIAARAVCDALSSARDSRALPDPSRVGTASGL